MQDLLQESPRTITPGHGRHAGGQIRFAFMSTDQVLAGFIVFQRFDYES
jgi:hypothetical protein